jgi:Kef-type K+ transport system membrane component KefB
VSGHAPVGALGSHQLVVFLLQIGILLLLATCLGRMACRLGMPAIVGELLSGLLLGPAVFHQLAPGAADWLLPAQPGQRNLLDAVSQLALLLLVGITGMQLDLRQLSSRRCTVILVGATSLSFPLLLGLLGGPLVPSALLGQAPRLGFTVFLGVALSLGSIPVIAKTLSDVGLLHKEVGQLTVATASVEDGVAWLLLSFTSTLAVHGASVRHAAATCVALVGFVAVAALPGRLVVRAAMRAAGRSGEPGLPAAVAVVVIMLGAGATQALGLEAVFGAFAVGVLIGSTGAEPHRCLAPLRVVTMSVLAPIFLATTGLRVDPTALGNPRTVLTGLLVLALATTGKVAGGYVGGRFSGMRHWESVALGSALNARGVVGIVAAGVGLRAGLLSNAMYTIVTLVALTTSITAGPLLVWAVAKDDRAQSAAAAARLPRMRQEPASLARDPHGGAVAVVPET